MPPPVFHNQLQHALTEGNGAAGKPGAPNGSPCSAAAATHPPMSIWQAVSDGLSNNSCSAGSLTASGAKTMPHMPLASPLPQPQHVTSSRDAVPADGLRPPPHVSSHGQLPHLTVAQDQAHHQIRVQLAPASAQDLASKPPPPPSSSLPLPLFTSAGVGAQGGSPASDLSMMPLLTPPLPPPLLPHSRAASAKAGSGRRPRKAENAAQTAPLQRGLRDRSTLAAPLRITQDHENDSGSEDGDTHGRGKSSAGRRTSNTAVAPPLPPPPPPVDMGQVTESVRRAFGSTSSAASIEPAGPDAVVSCKGAKPATDAACAAGADAKPEPAVADSGASNAVAPKEALPIRKAAVQQQSETESPAAASAAAAGGQQEADPAAVNSAAVVAAAEQARVIWGRVKGYPFWPAQMMSDKEAVKRLSGVRHSKEATLPLMFFATLEVGWLAPRDTLTWDQGCAKGFHARKSPVRLAAGVAEVHAFLHPTAKRKAPKGWWAKPPSHATQQAVAAAARQQTAAVPPKQPLPQQQQVAEPPSPPARTAAAAADPRVMQLSLPHLRRVFAKLAPAFGEHGSIPYERMGKLELLQLLALPGVGNHPAVASVLSAALDTRPAWPQGEPRLPQEPRGFRLPGTVLRDRPPMYEHVKRNMWAPGLTKPKRLPKDDIPICCCRPPRPETPAADASAPPVQRVGCSEDCLNRHSFIHCDPKSCPAGIVCSNRPFYALRLPKMEVFLTRDRGWGVRAAEPIKRGSFVVEYAGEVISDVECGRRMREAKETGEPHYYMMELKTGLIIDARDKGNVARLINSSCAPNAESQKWHDAATGEVRIGIFAKEDIAVGAEITYDYMFQHHGLAAAAAAYRCRCGAPSCRGTMDSQPERFRDFGQRVEIFWEGDGAWYRGTVTGYSAATQKHTILYDDNEVERVVLDTVPHRWLMSEDATHRASPGRPTPPRDVKHGPRPTPFSDGPVGEDAMREETPKSSRKRKLSFEAAAANPYALPTRAGPRPPNKNQWLLSTWPSPSAEVSKPAANVQALDMRQPVQQQPALPALPPPSADAPAERAMHAGQQVQSIASGGLHSDGSRPAERMTEEPLAGADTAMPDAAPLAAQEQAPAAAAAAAPHPDGLPAPATMNHPAHEVAPAVDASSEQLAATSCADANLAAGGADASAPHAAAARPAGGQHPSAEPVAAALVQGRIQPDAAQPLGQQPVQPATAAHAAAAAAGRGPSQAERVTESGPTQSTVAAEAELPVAVQKPAAVEAAAAAAAPATEQRSAACRDASAAQLGVTVAAPLQQTADAQQPLPQQTVEAVTAKSDQHAAEPVSSPAAPRISVAEASAGSEQTLPQPVSHANKTALDVDAVSDLDPAAACATPLHPDPIWAPSLPSLPAASPTSAPPAAATGGAQPDAEAEDRK